MTYAERIENLKKDAREGKKLHGEAFDTLFDEALREMFLAERAAKQTETQKGA